MAIFILILLTIVCLGYAIYRSSAEHIIITEGNRQTVYGAPQDGLILGLCVFAASCVIAMVWLALDKDDERVTNRVIEERPSTVGRKVL